jgi:hypothetical protein
MCTASLPLCSSNKIHSRTVGVLVVSIHIPSTLLHIRSLCRRPSYRRVRGTFRAWLRDSQSQDHTKREKREQLNSGQLVRLAGHGAALVTKFHVNGEFRNCDNCSFTGSVDIDTSKTTWHAMVLVWECERISWAKVGWLLLLQNRWDGK